MSLQNPLENEEQLMPLFRADKRFKQKQEEGLKLYLLENHKTFSITNFLHGFNYNFALFWARNAFVASLIVFFLSGFSMLSAAEFALADQYKPSSLIGLNKIETRELTNSDIDNGVLNNSSDFQALPLTPDSQNSVYVYDTCGAAFKIPKTYSAQNESSDNSISISDNIISMGRAVIISQNENNQSSESIQNPNFKNEFFIDCYAVDPGINVQDLITSLDYLGNTNFLASISDTNKILTPATNLSIEIIYEVKVDQKNAYSAFVYQDILYVLNLPEGSQFQLDILAPTKSAIKL